MSSDGIEVRRGRWRRAAVPLGWMAGAVASPLAAAPHDLGTVPATLVHRFSVPLVREVIGGENGGPELALAADLDDDASETPITAWWTRRPGQPGRQGWSPFRHGVLAAVERARPETIYFVGDDWVLRRSTDGGETWTRRGELPGSEPFQLLAAERPGVLYVNSSESSTSDHLFRSTDAGRTWDDLGEVSVVGLAFSPADPDLVIGYAPGAIIRSRDAGDSFVDITPPGASGANEVVVARSDAAPGTLHVGKAA